MGSDERHFNVSAGSDGQSHKTVSTNHNLFHEEKGEPKQYRTEVLPLTSLTPYRQAKQAHSFPVVFLWSFWYVPVPCVAALKKCNKGKRKRIRKYYCNRSMCFFFFQMLSKTALKWTSSKSPTCVYLSLYINYIYTDTGRTTRLRLIKPGIKRWFYCFPGQMHSSLNWKRHHLFSLNLSLYGVYTFFVLKISIVRPTKLLRWFWFISAQNASAGVTLWVPTSGDSVRKD